MAFRHELDDFERFYASTYPRAFRTVLAIVREPGLADDVVQDAFVQAYRQRERFRGDAPVAAWFHRIAVNAALAALRRRARGLREIRVTDLGGATDRPTGDPSRQTTDRLSILDALDALTPTARAAVVLRYYHDLDYATIAGILGTSTSNVGAMLSRSLDRLRTELEPAGGAR